MANTSKRGFASMDGEKQRTIASKGGRAAHAKGTAHEWSSEEARAAGRKGGESRGGHGANNPPLYAQQTDEVAKPMEYPLNTGFLSGAGSLLRTGGPTAGRTAGRSAGSYSQEPSYSKESSYPLGRNYPENRNYVEDRNPDSRSLSANAAADRTV